MIRLRLLLGGCILLLMLGWILLLLLGWILLRWLEMGCKDILLLRWLLSRTRNRKIIYIRMLILYVVTTANEISSYPHERLGMFYQYLFMLLFLCCCCNHYYYYYYTPVFLHSFLCVAQ
jgi:hypothetical protein